MLFAFPVSLYFQIMSPHSCTYVQSYIKIQDWFMKCSGASWNLEKFGYVGEDSVTQLLQEEVDHNVKRGCLNLRNKINRSCFSSLF